jgi:hypothetical protein
MMMSRIASAALVAGVLMSASVAAQAAGVTTPTWPHTYQGSGAKVVVFQPQVKSWNNYTVLEGIAAVAVTPNGSSNATYGTAEFTAYTAADFTAGTVTITDPKVTVLHWPGQSQAQSAKLEGLVRSTVQLSNKVIPLATLLASIQAQKALPKSVALDTTTPPIFESEKPAILVTFDGDPILAPVEGTSLKYAVNTNWNIIQADSTYYLLNGDSWIKSASAQGPWSPTTAPASFAQLPNNDNWSDVRSHLNAPAPSAAQVPQVFVSTKSADMVLIDGAPKLASIQGTQLQYVSNTETDLFMYAPTKTWYALLSGRWFSASSLQGPWTFASSSLPADFSKIPVNSPRGRVLVSVPNTPQAQYAGAAANVPQIASVDPANTHLDVSYGPGAPQFKPIEGTALQYAVNTSYDVVKVSDTSYYAAYSGIWFTSSSPTGPWTVANGVPSVIYTIPPSSPLYQDTYIYAYANTGEPIIVNVNATPVPYAAGAALLYGFTAGYLSSYWWNGAYMYGTGYWYAPYYYPGAVPAYYGYPRTYTGGTYYNPATGAYGRSVSAYGPYGGGTAAAQYNPSTGTYARGASVYGPNGSAKGGSFYNPRYGVSGHTLQESDPYGSWGKSAVNTKYGTSYSGHATTANGSVAAASTTHGNTAVAKSANGDVYAGHDGNVYSNQNGSWQKYNGSSNSWSSVNSHPSSSTASSYHPTSTTSTSGYHPPAGSSGGFTHPAYNTSAYHPPSSTMDSLNRDYSARGAGSSGFSGFSGSRGGGGFRGR